MISGSASRRYARAILGIGQSQDNLESLTAEVERLASAIEHSADLRTVISSPVYTRDDQGRAIAAIAAKMGLSQVLTGTLGLMAQNRRLFVLPQLLSALRAMIADEKGEVTADVTAAAELTKAQATKLAATLKASVGKSVNLNISVDESLIGGLVVKLGSKMIDTSIRSKLASLQNSMKEVG